MRELEVEELLDENPREELVDESSGDDLSEVEEDIEEQIRMVFGSDTDSDTDAC